MIYYFQPGKIFLACDLWLKENLIQAHMLSPKTREQDSAFQPVK